MFDEMDKVIFDKYAFGKCVHYVSFYCYIYELTKELKVVRSYKLYKCERCGQEFE